MTEHLTGRVKWFNNKAGYGFITVIDDGAHANEDVFVHHTAVNVEDPQYKYLVQGEYLEFDLVKTDSGKHEWQAMAVSGIRGGKLMCETRRDARPVRNEEVVAEPQERETPKAPRQARPRQPRQPKETSESKEQKVRAPRQKNAPSEEKKEWTMVEGSEPKKPRGRKPKETKP
jgi:CspA family cold shock protein